MEMMALLDEEPIDGDLDATIVQRLEDPVDLLVVGRRDRFCDLKADRSDRGPIASAFTIQGGSI